MSFDALVVLGCPVTAGRLLPPAARRVARAAQAYRDGLAPYVVASGGGCWDGTVEADEFARELMAEGVPERALLLERHSRNTRQNAAFTAKLLRPLGLSRVGVVSCDWHLPRALLCFARAGLDAHPVPAASPALSRRRRALRQLHELGAWFCDWALAGR